MPETTKAGAPAPRSDSAELPQGAETRDRILDAAMDLFIEQGFDGTSLREIAERVGVTKAALYYYFPSKDEILLALHMRLHDFGREALKSLGDGPVTLRAWSELLESLLDQMLGEGRIFLLHERNQAAFEKLHRQEHDAEHEDIQNRFRTLLSDARMPLEDRVRMAASFGVVFSGIFLSGKAFAPASSDEVRAVLRDVVRDVLRTP